MSDTDQEIVSIVVGNYRLSGWQDVRITRGIEQCPPTFELQLTERYPGEPTEIAISPGDPCRIEIGGETVITGYVDRYNASITASSHDVRIIGRGKCQDLVDCSAKFQTYQLNGATLMAIANKLCAPFGISVVAPDGDSKPVPQFNVILTETPYEIIERICRWANFLAYENTDGNLVIARLGDTHMASGFAQGQNVQQANVSFSTDDRFTEIDPLYLSTAFLTDGGDSIPYIKNAGATDTSFPARADRTPRYRPLLIVSEQSQNSDAIAKARAQWDMARRIGRSQSIDLTVDSWRDSAGTLWTPNASAAINLPALKFENQTWLISQVTYARGEGGTTAEITLMPRTAFVPAPENLVAFDWQVAQDLPGGGASNIAPEAR